jgi:hypothetical protein
VKLHHTLPKKCTFDYFIRDLSDYILVKLVEIQCNHLNVTDRNHVGARGCKGDMTFVPEALKPELLVHLPRLISDPLGRGATSP